MQIDTNDQRLTAGERIRDIAGHDTTPRPPVPVGNRESLDEALGRDERKQGGADNAGPGYR